MAAEILRQLSTGETGARETVAIYAGYLYHTRPDEAVELLRTMLADPRDDIQHLARDTLHELTEDE